MGEIFISYQGISHTFALIGLITLLALKAASKGRSFGWALLVPVFWSFSAVMFWSLAGAEYDFSGFFLSMVGGACGGLGVWIIIEALDPASALPDENASAEAAEEAGAAKEIGPSCPSCGSTGHERHGAYLCSNPSCNLEFLGEALAPSSEA